MFEGKNIICNFGKPAVLVCTNNGCNSYLFVCSKTCECYKAHEGQCEVKNILELSNDIETILRRNFNRYEKG